MLSQFLESIAYIATVILHKDMPTLFITHMNYELQPGEAKGRK